MLNDRCSLLNSSSLVGLPGYLYYRAVPEADVTVGYPVPSIEIFRWITWFYIIEFLLILIEFKPCPIR